MLLLVSLAVLVLIGCSGKENADTPDKGIESNGSEKGETSKDQNLVIAVNENFISMDPHNTGDTNSNSVQSAMLEGLLGTDKDGKIINALAEDYSVSEDALVYSFKLKENV